MDIIDFRYRPPYGSYRETIMYRDLERAKRCSEAFGMNQSRLWLPGIWRHL